MSPREVEAFRLFAATQSDGVSAEQATLFEALHDETRKASGHISRIMVEEPITEGLDEQLYRALRFHVEGGDPAARVRHRVAEYRVLMSKHLYALADDRLAEAKALAMQYERFYDWLEIVNLQKSRLARIPSLAESEQARHELEAEESLVLERLVDYINYRNAAKEVHEAFRLPEHMEPASKSEWLTALFQRPLLHDPALPKSETSRYQFWHLRATYLYFMGDLPRAWDASGKLLKLVDDHPFLVEASPEAHVAAWFNHLSLALELGHHEAFNELLAEFQNLADSLVTDADSMSGQKMRQSVFVRAAFLQLKQVLFLGCVDEGLSVVEAIEARVAAFGERQDPFFRAQLPYLFAYVRFLAGAFDDALVNVNEVIAQTNLRDDVRAAALVMRQLIAFDLGDAALFHAHQKDAQGFLAYSNRLDATGAALLDVLAEAVEQGDPQIAHRQLTELHSSLQQREQNPFERNQLPPFDYVAWLESRITGKPFRELFRARGAGEAFRAIR